MPRRAGPASSRHRLSEWELGGGEEGRAEARLVPGGRRPPGPDSGERRNVNDTLQILLHGYL